MFTIVVTILALSINVAYAYPTEDTLGVQKVQQYKSNWCWVASSKSVLNHYGINTSQYSFCYTVKGNTYNNPASTYEVSSGLEDYGLDSTVISSSLSFNSIRTQIYNYNRPMIMCWLWNSGGGHMMVIDGYSESFGQNVYYMEPSDGKYHYASYSYITGGNHTWVETIYNFN